MTTINDKILFLNNHRLQLHLPAYTVPRKQRDTVVTLDITLGKFLFENAGTKNNKMKIAQNNPCTITLD